MISAILAAAVSFVEIDPGHFHAALVLNRSYPGVSREVKVFAPKGPELDAHLALVRDFNGREKDPTDWNETVCTGEDYLARAVAAHTDGAVAILAGRNDLKPDYELAMAKAGYHILADKPMAVTPEGFAKLEETVRKCERRGTLVDDIMTERHEITTILQRELSRDRAVYGEQELGTPGDPAITKESVHHFCKLVNGKPLTRPGWFYDVAKEGEGITDVTTHLVDLIQWEAFPEVPLVREDVKMLAARSWATPITATDYRLSTGLDKWPAYLLGAVDGKNVLQCRANGEFTYRLKGVCVKVSVRWNFMPPEGGGDTHYSLMRGTKAELVIRQGKEQGFRPALYVRPRADRDAVGAALAAAVARLSKTYPGIAVGAFADGAWRIEIPKAYDIGHEAHFSQEVAEFLGWLKNGDRPKWELQNLMVKYWTIREALLLSRQKPTEAEPCTQDQDATLPAKDIQIRDPFVVTDAANGRYLLLSSCFVPESRDFGFLGTGAKVYATRDLETFKPAKQVLDIPKDFGCRAFWAPEMHCFRGKWYLFGTINYERGKAPGKGARGTWTFVSDSMEGPFRPTGKRPITPVDWNALDGTFWEEDGKPYMVFCHEWTQIGTGEMCLVQMTDDLSAAVGEPKTLFKATDYTPTPANDRRHKLLDNVTDGPFLHRSPTSGKLYMIWANTRRQGYAEIVCESASGKVAGPWTNFHLLFERDGGHGMLFRKLDGSLALALHQPNRSPHERARFFDIEEAGGTLRIRPETSRTMPSFAARSSFPVSEGIDPNAKFGFTFFRQNGDLGVFLATSEDGLNWKEANGGKPVLPAVLDDRITRDPSVCIGPDGKYHMTFTTSWKSRGFGFAHSDDLIHWTTPEFLGINEDWPEAANTWAPEILWDASAKRYVVIYATAELKNRHHHRQYFTTTTDFKTWTPRQLYYENATSVIDSFPVRTDGKWLIISRDNKALRIVWSKDGLFGPWEPAGVRLDSDVCMAEGPSALRLDDGRWVVYFDCFKKKRYGSLVTRDFKTFEPIEVTLPKGIRHGTTFRLKGK